MEPDDYASGSPRRDYVYYDDEYGFPEFRGYRRGRYHASVEAPRFIREEDHLRAMDELENEWRRAVMVAEGDARALTTEARALRTLNAEQAAQLEKLRDPADTLAALEKTLAEALTENKALGEQVAAVERQRSITLQEYERVVQELTTVSERLEIAAGGTRCSIARLDDRPGCGQCNVCLRRECDRLRARLQGYEDAEAARLASTVVLPTRRVTMMQRPG